MNHFLTSLFNTVFKNFLRSLEGNQANSIGRANILTVGAVGRI